MIDWTKSMEQTFEYYLVDPGTWKDSKLLQNIKSSTLNRESDSDTLGSASFNIIDLIDECYIRVYLITIQNGVRERFPLGTYLVQSPSSSFNGKIREVSVNAYTPLIELKESQPEIGYFVEKGADILERGYQQIREHARAPVVKPIGVSEKLQSHFIANLDETWCVFSKALIANSKYELCLDEMGRILFKPMEEVNNMTPVWTFDDDNSSILLPEISVDHDLYGIPNVVEVTYSNGKNMYHAVVKNEDENSPTSIQARGREIIYRESEPNLTGMASETQIKLYAEDLLKKLSSVEYTISYSHGYCPVRLGDCVRLNYQKAGIMNVKAKVISQSIQCKTGCKVTEKSVFTTNLWR